MAEEWPLDATVRLIVAERRNWLAVQSEPLDPTASEDKRKQRRRLKRCEELFGPQIETLDALRARLQELSEAADDPERAERWFTTRGIEPPSGRAGDQTEAAYLCDVVGCLVQRAADDIILNLAPVFRFVPGKPNECLKRDHIYLDVSHLSQDEVTPHLGMTGMW